MFTFILFQERKKALAMAIVLGVALAVLAAVLVPAVIAAPPRFKTVEARVREVHEGTGPEDPSWVEYKYEYKALTYLVRFEGPTGSLREGGKAPLHINVRQPDMVLRERPQGSEIVALILIAGSSVGVLFVGALVNCIFVFRKEKANADPEL